MRAPGQQPSPKRKRLQRTPIAYNGASNQTAKGRGARVRQQLEEIQRLENREHRLWHLLELVQRQALLYARTARSSRPRGISNPSRGQGRLLMTLDHLGEVAQSDLTGMFGMRQQSVAELLAKLEKKGLVERHPSEQDRRKTMVRITNEGQAEAAQLQQQGHALTFFDCLRDEEKEQLEEYLLRISASLDEALGTNGER